MPSPFKPVPGTWRILETNSYRQVKLPLAPREFKSGDAMWLDVVSNVSWLESALNTPSGYSTNPLATAAGVLATYASTSASLAAEQAAFAALFMGILMNHRTPRSFNKYLNFASPIVGGAIYYDTTAPYGTVVTSGIADVPYLDYAGNASVQVAAAIGTPVGLSGFLNAIPYFTDASGMVPTATKYYLYPNAVTHLSASGTAITAAGTIGRLVKDAKVGDTIVRIEFSCELSGQVLGQVAGEMVN